MGGDFWRAFRADTHVRAVFTFLFVFYALTVPVGIYLVGLVSGRAAVTLAVAAHAVIIPTTIAEARAHLMPADAR